MDTHSDCPNCGASVSDRAAVCPNCGHRNLKSHAIKGATGCMSAILVLAALMFGVCGGCLVISASGGPNAWQGMGGAFGILGLMGLGIAVLLGYLAIQVNK